MKKVNEKRKMKEFAYDKHDFILKYIAEKTGWFYEPEDFSKWSSTSRYTVDKEDGKYQF